jgi:hypothetical protein
MTPEEMQSFRESLVNANRVIALCGAGLSAASGLGVSPSINLCSLPRLSVVQEDGGETMKLQNSQLRKRSLVTLL